MNKYDVIISSLALAFMIFLMIAIGVSRYWDHKENMLKIQLQVDNISAVEK